MDGLFDLYWKTATQDEFNFFKKIKVQNWFLHLKVDPLLSQNYVSIIKIDEQGIMTRKNERLVGKGQSQEEGINYDKTFTLITSLKSFRIFLPFVAHSNFLD